MFWNNWWCGAGPTWPYASNEYQQNLDWIIGIVWDLGQKVKELSSSIENIQELVSEEVAKELEVQLQPVYTQLNNMSTEIETINNTVTEHYAELLILKAKHDHDYNELNDKINNLEFELPDVLNPVKGIMDSLQNTLNDIYFNTFSTWISPEEFDTLDITPEEFDGITITPDEFDTEGKTILEAAFGNRP